MRDDRHGNIRDLADFNQSLPEWSMLDGCFPRRIRPMDEDGCIEVNGYCLYLEKKRRRADIETGQLKTMFTQVRQGNTVIVFWGEATDGSDITHIRVLEPGRPPHKTKRRPATLGDLRAEAIHWFQVAEASPPHPTVEAMKRREQRVTETGAVACLCANRRVRRWVVPAAWARDPGEKVWYCAECEPFEGEAETDWVETSA